jgi:hypothetical protein
MDSGIAMVVRCPIFGWSLSDAGGAEDGSGFQPLAFLPTANPARWAGLV